MNKTIDISLAGILFHLDESAYFKLKKYLKSVRNSLQQTDDIEEVMNEIEARIAELFIEKQAHPQQVINEGHIDEIIGVMGQPEDYEEESVEPTSTHYRTSKKGLFRDPDKSVLGGVVAGLAHYLGIDMTLLRIIFFVLVVVTHGTLILIYLLLWIVMPKAKTASDKLKMKGEKVDVDSIVDQVSTEDDSVKKKIKIGEKMENTTKEFGNIIIKLIGLLIAFVAGSVLVSLLISIASLAPVFSIHSPISGLHIQEIIGMSAGSIGVLSFILVGFPFAVLFLLGIKMLFPNTKSVGRNVFLALGTIWFLSIIFTISRTSALLWSKNTEMKSLVVKKDWQQAKDTLYLTSFEDTIQTPVNYIEQKPVYYHIYPSDDASFHLKVYHKAEGANKSDAKENAKKIRFSFYLDTINNQVDFDKYMMYPAEEFFIKHRVYVDVYIPENKYVKLSGNISGHTTNWDCDSPKVLQNKEAEIACIESYDDDENMDDGVKIRTRNMRLKVDGSGVRISSRDPKDGQAEIVVDNNGVSIKAKEKDGDSTSINVDENGVRVQNGKNK